MLEGRSLNLRLRKNAKERRIAPRSPVSVEIDLRNAERSRLRAELREISATGFRLHCPALLPIDGKIVIYIPSFEGFSARVIWREDNLYGCEFLNSLYPAVVDHIAARF